MQTVTVFYIYITKKVEREGFTDPYMSFKVTFAPLPTFGNHHKIYNKYKLCFKTNMF